MAPLWPTLDVGPPLMNRRSFLQSILAAGVAPWVMSNGVAGGVLMPVRQIVTLDSPWWTMMHGLTAEEIIRRDLTVAMAQATDDLLLYGNCLTTPRIAKALGLL